MNNTQTNEYKFVNYTNGEPRYLLETSSHTTISDAESHAVANYAKPVEIMQGKRSVSWVWPGGRAAHE